MILIRQTNSPMSRLKSHAPIFSVRSEVRFTAASGENPRLSTDSLRCVACRIFPAKIGRKLLSTPRQVVSRLSLRYRNPLNRCERSTVAASLAITGMKCSAVVTIKASGAGTRNCVSARRRSRGCVVQTMKHPMTRVVLKRRD